jgi:GNAT superfamily N-acetyltransferase
MPIAIRRRQDAVPSLTQIAAFEVRSTSDVDLLQRLTGRAEHELSRRLQSGHRAYVAWYDGVPAAFGWVATEAAEIGELHASFRIEAGERYLWNFVTLPSHRGLGIYPRLLDAIVRAVSVDVLFLF